MFCEVKLTYLKDLINSRTKAFSSLRSAKELLEENMGWVTREGNNNKVKVRLVDSHQYNYQALPVYRGLRPA